jgi:uncharacterized protein YcbK (DUF882 family)
MKKLKHVKIKNTGILFELLVRQIASDTMNNKTSPANKLIKRHFTHNSELAKELQMYQSLVHEKFNSESKSDKFISAVLAAKKQLNETALRRQKYNLIKDINESFDSTEFFNSRVNNYKTLASIYILFEYAENENPSDMVKSRFSLVEHITSNGKATKPVETVINETYTSQDKDIRLLSYKMLIDKFNSKYDNLDANQKNILREYINNVSNTVGLREFVKKEIPKLKTAIAESSKHIDSKVVKIKLNEVTNMLGTLSKVNVIKDSHILTIMRYYDLVKELKTIK